MMAVVITNLYFDGYMVITNLHILMATVITNLYFDGYGYHLPSYFDGYGDH